MPAHAHQPLALIGVLARRGEDDLRALARVARGEQIPEDRADSLRRAGLLRAGPRQALPAALIAPVLALEAALGLRGGGTIVELVKLLQGAETADQRDLLLDALRDQLEEHLAALDADGAHKLDVEALRPALDDLAQTVERLKLGGCDPAQATAVAQLCAKLIERLAGTIQPRRRARRRQAPEVVVDHIPDADRPRLLADAVYDMQFASPRLITVPSEQALARALLGAEAIPAASRRIEHLDAAPQKDRRREVLDALTGADINTALYHGAGIEEAFLRHLTLIGLGPAQLRDRAVVSSAERRPGPAPLSWSTALTRRVEEGRVAA